MQKPAAVQGEDFNQTEGHSEHRARFPTRARRPLDSIILEPAI